MCPGTTNRRDTRYEKETVLGRAESVEIGVSYSYERLRPGFRDAVGLGPPVYVHVCSFVLGVWLVLLALLGGS